ncbi:PREDICTED: venom protease-like [Papilio xuthus]|uniref:Venom protease-like n=1 Tax=Papilio xuthus TaxID=66420 RepID=A0AAJ6ZEF1_PAPXU
MLRNMLTVLLLIIVSASGQLVPRTCDDCILLSACPGAVYQVANHKNKRTEEIIRSSICSSEYVNSIPKVCCSAFPPSQEEIDNHPNLNLLPSECGEIEGSQIVGGEAAKLYEFPWIVLISYETRIGKQFLCGGSLINSLYVMTAAHCVRDKKIAGVRIGDHDYSSKVDCEKDTDICESHYQDIGVSERIIYPSYQGPPVVRHDIALLRLKRPADLSRRNYGTICLPTSKNLRERNLDEERAVVAGWGLTDNNTVSTLLLKVTVPIRSSDNCKQYYGRNSKEDITKTILCAGELGKDSCKGDSGGPLMVAEEVDNVYKYIQHGIVSHGPSKCGSLFPGVYTDVSWYIKWILDTIKP